MKITYKTVKPMNVRMVMTYGVFVRRVWSDTAGDNRGQQNRI